MAASITGTFTIIDRASGTMRKMEAQARKTQAAVEGLGDKLDRAGGTEATRRSFERTERQLRNIDREAARSSQGAGGLSRAFRDSGRQADSLTSRLIRLGGTLGALRLLMRAGLFAGLAVGLTSLIQGVGVLGGGLVALIPRLADTVGLLAALPATAGAAAQGIATLSLALGGVGAALKAGMKDQVAAGRTAAQSAETQRNAANRIEAAEESLRMAQQAQRDAQLGLTQARRDAVRQLQDMRMAAAGSALSEQRATLALRQARDALTEGFAAGESGTVMADLQLGVREARFALRQARLEGRRSQVDARRAERGGPQRMPELVQGRRAVTDANRQARAATRGLADAQQDANAQMARGTTTVNAFQEAMEGLSPEARSFVQTLLDMRPAMSALRASAGRELFPALERALGRATRLLPIFNRNLRATGGVIGRQAEGLAGDLTTNARLADINTLMGHQAGLLSRLGISIRNLAAGFIDLGVAARPFTNWLADTVTGWTQYWKTLALVGRWTGSTRDRLERTRGSLEVLGRITRNVWRIFGGLGAAARPLGDALWGGADRATKRWADYLQTVEGSSRARDWFNRLKRPLHELGQITKGVAGAFARLTVDENFVETLQRLRQAGPHIERFLFSLSSLGPHAADLLGEIARLLANLPLQPLTLFVRALTTMLRIVNFLLEKVPGLGVMMSGLITAALIGKVMTYLGRVRLLAGAWAAVRTAILGAGAAQTAVGAGGVAATAGRFAPWLAGASRVAGPLVAAGVATHEVAKRPTDPASGLQKQSWSDRMTDRLFGQGGADMGARAADKARNAALRFGNTAGDLFADAKRWRDEGSLLRLSNQAERLARRFPEGAAGLNKFARSARHAAADIRNMKLGQAMQDQLLGMNRVTQRNTRSIIARLRRMTPAAREIAKQQMVQMAAEMERMGYLPKGSARRLARNINKELDKTADHAAGVGRKVSLQLRRGIAEGFAEGIRRNDGVNPFTGKRERPQTGGQIDRQLRQGDTRLRRRESLQTGVARVTPAELRRMQRNWGLTPDAIIGPQTRREARAHGVRLKLVRSVNDLIGKSHARTGRTVARSSKNTADEVGRWSARARRMVTDDNRRINTHSRKSWGDTRKAIADAAQKAQREAGGSFDKLVGQATRNLISMGYSRAEARRLLAGGSSSAGGRGGLTRPGPQTAAYGARIRGAGLRDTVPLAGGGAIGAPGELVVNRHTERRVDNKLAPYGTSLGHEVAGETRPHSAGVLARAGGAPPSAQVWMGIMPGLARGGRIRGGGSSLQRMVAEANRIDREKYIYSWGGGHNATFTGPYDCSGAVSAILHAGGKLGSPLVSGALAGWGEAGPGVVTIYANPGHTYMSLNNRFFGTSGANPGGGAGWFPGGARPGFTVRHVPGIESAAGVDWNAIGAPGVGGGPAAVELMKALRPPRSRFRGVPGAMSNRASQTLAKGLRRQINMRISAAGGGAGGGAYRGRLDRDFGAGSNTTIGFNQAAMLAEKAGLPGITYAQIAQGESGLRPGAVSPDGGHGLWQMTPRVQSFSTVAKWNAIGSYYNPWNNALMAKVLAGSGTGVSNYYGTGFVRDFNKHYTGRMAQGGRIPAPPHGRMRNHADWAGWHARGGRFRARRPTVFGVGEDGEEEVSIHKTGGGGGGTGRGRRPRGQAPQIHVKIGRIDYRREGDIQKAIESELNKVGERLEFISVDEDDDD